MRFHRPHGLIEPVHEREVVRLVLKQRGVRVRVRVDQPRQDKPAVKSDYLARKRDFVFVTDAENQVALNGHPPAGKETITPVYGQDRAVCEGIGGFLLHAALLSRSVRRMLPGLWPFVRRRRARSA
ncbi:hypothetical protein SDC9_145242 [bioreactor metagenome]|uniref:Uncharacterized protein n=1 Tax=bioreactor metagenome TaxID=1076179 RepID=A0A645E9F2_9ZZZZ